MSGRRRGQRFDADLGVTTEALLFLGELDPERIGPSIEFATHYEPTPVDEALALLDAAIERPDGTTFVDLGCGMGRVVLLAARRPFHAVYGVEISPALAEIARENLAATADDPLRRCRDVRILRGDALRWSPPAGPLAVYLYNPFGAPILERVLERLEAHDAPVTLIYHTPVERATIEARAAWIAVDAPAGGAIWRRTG